MASLTDPDTWKLVKRLVIKDMPEFEKISMQFHFSLTKNGKDPNQLVFARQEHILVLNFLTEQVTILYTFEVPLYRQPAFFSMNDD